ncbi:putative serine/threonine-protein kinase iks1 [Serendipita sp. 400]|nr:putative serine/threonine-protein kinase iks1 [Serendipita sp. 400]
MGPLDLGPEEEVHSRIHNNSESVETIGIGGIGIGGGTGGGGGGDGTGDRIVQRGEVSRRAPNYFQLLETSFEAQRRPPPLLSAPSSSISVVPSPSSEFVDTPVTPDNSSSRYSSTYSLRGQPGPSLSSSSSSSVPLRSVEGGGERARRKHGFGGLVNEDSRPTTPQPRFSENSMAQGYFTAFFKEEKRLGMGANGTVYLCQHILNGNYLGHFAVKKIAVGHSHEYLLRILKEVRLLETLRHPNIITYHHSWLETTRFSSFGPSIPTLHVLMEWAECGSLDDLIDARLGKRAEVIPGSVVEDEETTSRSSRIRAFKAAKHTQEPGASKDRNRGRSGSIGVHMLNAEEIKSFLSDIVSGLAFLHDRSILHLDLKMGNVLLTRDEERTIPRAMLSDFGTSQDALQTSRVRSGNTGTVEYSAPEALLRDQSGSLLQLDSKSDMWSLGMILHKLIFFRLPYPDIDASDVNGIEREVLAYPGWKATPDMIASCKRRGLPRATLLLLESLLNRNPRERPTSDRVLNALKEGMPETHSRSKRRDAGAIVRRRSSSSGETRSISPLTIRQSIDTSASHQSETIIPPSSPLISTLQNSKGRSLPDTLTSLLLPFPLQAYARMVRTRWRTLRSCLLVLKILSLSSVCQGAYPLLWVQSVLIACAVLDVWQENEEDGRGDLRVSFALLFIHFFILGIVRVNQSRFCLA